MAKTVTTQATGKWWKLTQLVGAAMIIVGTWGYWNAVNSDGPKSTNDARAAKYAILFLGGVPIFVVGKAGAWWFHG